MYFTIYRDGQNQYRWNLKSGNHEIIASGESYHRKDTALHAVALVNGKNGYRVDDQTQSQGLLAGLLGTQLPQPVFGLGLPNATSAWTVARHGITPQTGALSAFFDPAKTK